MIYVMFPAFNEEEAIGDALTGLWQAMRGRPEPWCAVLVDDGSTDATVAVAERAAAATQGGMTLHVLRHGDNRGLGAGLRTGIYWVLDRAGDDDVLVTLDADNTHPPGLIPGMIDKLRAERLDLVIASRYRRGAIVHGVPRHRRLLSDGGRLLFQALLRIPGVRDFTCCFRAFTVPLLRRARAVYGENWLDARGFEAVMDLLLRLRQVGLRAGEVPIELQYEKRVGRSKMKVLRTIRRTLTLLFRRRIESFGRYSPRRVRAVLGERVPARP